VRAARGLVESGVAREVRVQCREAVEPADGVVALGMIPREELAKELAAADVVVTHGGSGSCFEALAAGFRPVIVPRRASLAEHVDEHQTDVAKELSRRGAAAMLTETEPGALARELVEAVAGAPPRAAPAPAGSSRVGARLRALADREPGPRSAREGFRVARVDGETYRAFYRSAPYPHPLQSTAWGDARRLDRWAPTWWLAYGEHGEALAGAQALARRRRPGLPLYVPYGPIATSGPRGGRAASALLARLARASVGGVLWAPYPTPEGVQGSARGAKTLAPPSWTGFVPLAEDAALFARMRATWRHEAEQAQSDPTLFVRREPPGTLVPAVLKAVHALSSTKGFRAPIRPEVGTAFALAAPGAGVDLACVSVQTEGRRSHAYVVACAGRWGLTLWTAQEADSPGAGRVALLAAMREARGRGCATYDLSGIDDVGAPGVARFKRGLRPDLVEVPGIRWIPPAWMPRALVGPASRRIAKALESRR